MPTRGVNDDDDGTYDIDVGSGFGIYTSKDVSHEQDDDPFAQAADEIKALGGVTSNKKRSITAMQKRYEGKDGTESKKLEDHIVTGYNAFETVLPPYNLDYLARLYDISAWHSAAVGAKVSNIVGLGYDFTPSSVVNNKMDTLGPEQTDKYQKKLSVAKQILFDLLDDLNEEDTFQEILIKVWTDYETTGNGYLEIARSETTGKIGYIGHVPAATIRLRRRRDGFVQIISNKAVFFRNFGKTDVDPIGGDPNPSELIHFKKYSPSSTYYGVPEIVSAKQAIAGNDFSAKFNLDYFEHKAVPRYAVILKGATINPQLAKNLLEFFETGLKGKNHRSLFIPLPADTAERKVSIDFQPIEAGTQDSSFNNYRIANIDEILAAHRVPITKVSLAKNAALALARDADKTFKEQVCQPAQKIAEKKLNKVVKELTDMFLLKLNELTLTDAVTQANIDMMRRKTGTETANEQRIPRGRPSHPDGDDLNNMLPIPNMDDAGPQPVAPAGGSGGKPAGGRARDLSRAGNKTDTSGEGRNPKGEGRSNTAG